MIGIIALFLLFWGALILLAIHLRCQEYNAAVIFFWRRIRKVLEKRNDLLAEAILIAMQNGYPKAEQLNLLQNMRTSGETIFDVKERGEFEIAVGDVTHTFLQNLEAFKPHCVQHIEYALQQVEKELEKARADYNTIVKEMTFFLYTAPECFIARLLGFKPAEFYQIDQQLLLK